MLAFLWENAKSQNSLKIYPPAPCLINRAVLVRSIYGKYPLNPPKIATKGFSTDSGRA